MTDYVPDDDQLIRLELLQEGFTPEAFDEFMGNRPTKSLGLAHRAIPAVVAAHC